MRSQTRSSREKETIGRLPSLLCSKKQRKNQADAANNRIEKPATKSYIHLVNFLRIVRILVCKSILTYIMRTEKKEEKRVKKL